MKLLDPSEIRQEKAESAEQAVERTRKLANEESKLARQVNIARSESTAEIEKINAEVVEHKKQKEQEKALLTQEVEKLKDERAMLLKPIGEIRKQAEEILVAAKAHKDEIDREVQIVVENRAENQEFAEELEDRREELDEREKKIQKKEDATRDEELRIAGATKTLSGEWVKYHATVNEFNKKVDQTAQKEAELTTKENAIAIRMREQNRRETELNEQDRAIKDKYHSLEVARNEILGRTT